MTARRAAVTAYARAKLVFAQHAVAITQFSRKESALYVKSTVILC